MDEDGNHEVPPSPRQRGLSLFHLHIPAPNLPSWNSPSLPTFLVTPATPDANTSRRFSFLSSPSSTPSINSLRKFSFASLRKFSTSSLHRSDSMVSLCYRTLLSYITDDNLPGLQTFLENKRVIVDDRDENGGTALHYAAAKGKLQFVRELINHGADVNAEDNDNWTALLCAAKEGHTDICIELLDHGALIEHRDMGGWSALMWATYKGHVQTVELFLERNADVNAHGNYHISSLLWASGRGHTDIVKMLVRRGAKVNVGDKYGTTALVWACRKGNVEIVDCLLKAGANVDTAGMYSWTPLLVASVGNHVEVVNLLLEYRPNVNALDKDGCTALTIACKEGYYDIAVALLNVGAYINIQDRSGDTNLIHAVKSGHRSVVEALLKKYADVDIPGKDRKTATNTAVEKGNIPILKLLLSANPDLEIATKDGDTCLLRAVRSRNAEAVQLLLEKKAKVSACDKRGDTALHIAMRARSKHIVEVLLRNPKNSQLLYRPNRAGETPYNIDMNHQKTILGQIFGARRLNTNEDNENLLGYDLYSSALADILSEPSLSMPITVGLYAKWGSGKSFLLNKLREEMKNFARQWVDPMFQFSWLLLAIIAHFTLIIGLTVGLVVGVWLVGLIIAVILFILSYTFLVLIWYGGQRYNWDWPYNLNIYLTQKMNAVRVILQVIFCHPPGAQWSDSQTAQPIRFYFTDQTRVSSTTAGENSVVQMIGSLYDSIENDYGPLSTRLYRAFRPKPLKSTSSWRFRRLCCLPNIVLFELFFVSTLTGLTVLTIYLMELDFLQLNLTLDHITAHIILFVCGTIVSLCVVANVYTISRVLQALVFSQRRQLQRAIAKLDTLKSEGFLQALRSEVNLMTEMVKCLDAFTQQQTRLVIIVDGLDSCEQDKVLLVLDAVHVLFSDANRPFIIILAIDPHVISKAVEINSRRLLSESNIGGHDYLRNMVHLPFYLQNSGLRKVKVAQKSAQSHRKSVTVQPQYESQPETTLTVSSSSRRLSTESGGLSSQEKLKLPPVTVGRKGSRKLKMSESIASSLGSNLNRAGGAHDLTKMLLTDDYFSDVNPRSMRRLMNVVYVTGRLLKAFQIDFNWYHLASWVNITEQWPFRTSWLILSHDAAEDSLDDNTSLKTLYDKIRPQIPVSKEVEPLLELDRDERKFDIFLTFHRSSLLVSDLRIFLPFTINLDPYIKKVIKEDQQNMEEAFVLLNPSYSQQAVAPTPPMHAPPSWSATTMQPATSTDTTAWGLRKSSLLRRQRSLHRTAGVQIPQPPVVYTNANLGWSPNWGVSDTVLRPPYIPVSPATQLPDLLETKLSTLSVDGVCHLLNKIDDLQGAQVSHYISTIQNNNINGRVLLYCDLDELKKVMQMNFGDWELFRMVIISLREHEVTSIMQMEETSSSRNVRFATQDMTQDRRNSNSKCQQSTTSQVDKDRVVAKQTVMEKQVTLEEQMICGALQTLNEEACEDVLEEADEQVSNSLQVPDSGELSKAGGHIHTLSQSSCFSSATDVRETDMLILQQPSPLHPPFWTPVSGSGLCESQSATNSLANTPVLARRRRDSKITLYLTHEPVLSYPQPYPMVPKFVHQFFFHHYPFVASDGKSAMKSLPGSRPSSLLVSVPGEDENYIMNSTTTRSLSVDETSKNPINKQPNTSLLSSLASSLLGNRRSIQNGTPALTVTPAGSIEALTRVCRFQDGGSNVSSDDESTPLVSEMSSPSSGPNRVSGEFSNQGFGPTDSPGSSEVSPTSFKSTPTYEQHSSTESISRTVEVDGAQGYHSFRTFGGSHDGDVKLSTRMAHSLSRQNAVDSDEDKSYLTWDDPETTV